MDDGVDADEDLDDIGTIFGKGSIGSFEFLDAKCCTSVESESIMVLVVDIGVGR